MLIYATAEQLTAWPVVVATEKVVPLLRSASILVRAATLTAFYDTDATGKATDATVLAAFADATCAQVGTWVALAIDPAKGAADSGSTVASKKIGSASVDYAVYAATAQARADAATSLSQEAALILADAGLLTRSLVVYG